MKRTSVGLLFVVLAFAFGASASARELGPAASCKIVTKKVHEKKKRVHVCTKPKPPGMPPAATVVAKIPISGTDSLDCCLAQLGLGSVG